MTITREPLNKLFGLRVSKSTKNHSGDVICFDYLPDREDHTKAFLPKRDDAYVFPLDELIDVGIALDQNMPLLVHGLHGSGKSTLLEQFCLRVNRPALRIQHSVDTEGSDIVGGWVLEGDKTVFHYGPLARAMRDGLVYIADEYDFALPNVLAIYQAVLENGALFIKNAPEDMAMVTPHPDFRFAATGNTNGAGDETGLYQGTQMQNAANYSRFGMTIKLHYQSEAVEKEILKGKLGEIPDVDLKLLAEFTKLVRKAYDDRTITNTFSTRELINVARLALLRGHDRMNFKYGITRGFTNRMSTIDAAAINNISNRVFD